VWLPFASVVKEKGDLWSFSQGFCCHLGLRRSVLAFMVRAGRVFDGETVVMVATGDQN